jgi:outer membrane murein-binding lipoprotein Lpp
MNLMIRNGYLGGLLVSLLVVGCATTSPPSASTNQRTTDAQFAQQYRQQSFAHAMRASNEDVGQARARINAWVRFNLQRALDYKAQGSTDAALFHLDAARYTLRCVTAPLANDEFGNPAVYQGRSPIQDGGTRTYTWRDRVDEDVERIFASGVVPAGDMLKMYGIDTPGGPVDRPGQLPRVASR